MRWKRRLMALVVCWIVVVVQLGDQVALPLQLTALLLAAAGGFSLDDSAYEVLAPSPHSLLRRRLQRILVVVPPTVVAWMAAWAAIVWQGSSNPEEFGALLAMFGGLVGLSLGVAGVAGRRSSGRGGPLLTPSIFVLQVVSTAFPPRWRFLPLGDVPGGWSQIYLRWTAVGVVGVLFLLVSSRDPARARYPSPATRRPQERNRRKSE